MDQIREALVGREDQLADLAAALQTAQSGDAQVVVITGEAGIGKSRLLAELAATAREQGWLTLSGRAAEFESDLPFGLVIDAFDAHLTTLSDKDVGRLSMDRLGALAAVFPAFISLGGAVEYPVTSNERFRVHRAVAELIERLAARQPMLLVLDDLHWADSASLELVAHVARRPIEAPLMVALGTRPPTPSSPSFRAITAIRNFEGVIDTTLPPLDRGSVGHLVGVDNESDLDRLHHLSGGNPFYALQLARSSARPEDDGGGADGDVPRSVMQSIDAELGLLSEHAREVAEAAAVVGDPFDLELAVAASDLPEPAVLTCIDELTSCDVLRPTNTPREMQFRHPLVRNAIYQGSMPGTRLARHRRIAACLRERGAAATDIAVHVENSARHGDASSVALLETAALSVSAQAPASASRWYSTALTLMPASAGPEQRMRLLDGLASARVALGDFAGGLTARRHSLAIVPRPDLTSRISLTVSCAEAERLLGQPQQAADRLGHEYEMLDDKTSAEAVRLCVALSSNAIYTGDFDGMFRWGREAERVAEGRGDPALLVAAGAALTSGAAFAGHIGEALALHRRVGPLVDALDDAATADDLGTLCTFAGAEMYLDRYAAAVAHAERGLAIARSTAQSQLVPYLSPIAGTCSWVLGDTHRSGVVLDDAIDAARLIDDSVSLGWHLFNRSLCALMAGDLESALATSAESVELLVSGDTTMMSAFSAAVRAHVLHEAGRTEESLALLVGHAGGEELTGLPGGWRGVYLELLARCHLSLGDVAAASDAADRARTVATELPLDITAMAADRSEALVALEQRGIERAIDLAASAIDHSRAMHSPVYVAISQTLLAQALVAAGRVGDAVDQHRLAADGYDALGATRYRNQVEAQLRALGQKVHRRTRPGERGAGIAALTGRELEVARLIQGRHTNREIAEQLFLSLKTVESHVRNLFIKLDVTSRVAVARLLDAQATSG